MKSKKIKILFVFLVLFAIVFAGLVTYVSQKISSEDIRNLVLQQLEKTFPGAQIELGKIDLMIGASIKLDIERLKLTLRQNNRVLLDSKQLNVKVPLWSILTGGGTITLQLTRPQIQYEEFKKQTNWHLAMNRSTGPPAAVKRKETSIDVTPSMEKMSLPAFLTNSKLNIKIKDVLVGYKLRSKDEGELILSRLFVKNLNFRSATAFEIASTVSFKTSSKEKLQLEAQVVGDLNLHHYLEGKDLSGVVVIDLNHIELPSLPNSIPNIKTNLKFLMNQKGSVEGTIETNLANSRIAFSFGLQREDLSISKLIGKLSLTQLTEILGLQQSHLHFEDSILSFNGGIVRKKSQLYPKLDFQITPPLGVELDEDTKITSELSGALGTNHLFKLKLRNKVLGGTLNIQTAANVNLNQTPFKIQNLSPVRAEFLAQNIQLSKEFIRKKIYGSENAESRSGSRNPDPNSAHSASKKKKLSNRPAPVLPNSKISIKWDGVKIGEEVSTGSGVVEAKGRQIYSKGFRFNFSKGSGRFGFKTNLKNNSSSNTDFDFMLNHLNLNSLKTFLPVGMEGVEGVLSGKVAGELVSISQSTETKFAINTNITAKNGHIKGLKPQEMFSGLISSIPLLKSKVKDLKISERFDSMEIVGHFSNISYHFKKIKYLDNKKSMEIRGTGTLYPIKTGKEGRLDLVLIDLAGKLGLNKHIGSNQLPVRLKGNGFNLRPDYSYTIEKVAKSAFKTKGKKAIKKATDKLFKKDNLKKLFKGFKF